MGGGEMVQQRRLVGKIGGPVVGLSVAYIHGGAHHAT